MKTIYNNFRKIAAIFCLLVVFGCETIETDLTENPNALTADEASLEFLFNQVQITLNTFFQGLQFQEAQVTRMEAMRSSPFYAAQFTAESFNNAWIRAYANLLIEIQQLKEIAALIETDDINANDFIASSQIIEAYTIATLVDTFGNVPYSEALQGSGNFDPGRDAGRDIYEEARNLLLDAISKIDAGGSVNIDSDLYYNGNMDNWRALANSLLLKLAVSSRLNNNQAASQANAVINSGNFISNNNGDFQFNYSTTSDPAESRHPLFTAQYISGAAIYMANSFLERMDGDPRFNYYFYQQDGPGDYEYPPTSGNFEGRDHGDAGPPVASDFSRITVHGLYPAGGKYNFGTGTTNQEDGAAGAGASIIMTNAFTQFLIAEAELTLNNNPGAARAALINGVTASINKVTSFQTSAIPSDANNVPSQTDINTYITGVEQRFDDATGQQGRLDVIITEYYKSLWGNGIEVYNNLRRTGFPSDLAPSIVSNPGPFTNSMLYPSVYITNNNNPDAEQKESVAEKVWWAEGTTFNLDF